VRAAVLLDGHGRLGHQLLGAEPGRAEAVRAALVSGRPEHEKR
jgi:hypothetical protein